MESNLLAVCYLLASVTFILGLKMLSHPATARRGNLIAAAGMLVAIVGTIFLYQHEGQHLHNFGWIFVAMLLGALVGTYSARKIQMTAMPEMVSLFNGMGGACAALISMVEFDHLVNQQLWVRDLNVLLPTTLGSSTGPGPSLPQGQLLIILIGVFIGSISFAGSVLAWAKLNGRVKDVAFKGQHLLNLVLLVLIVASAAYLLLHVDQGVGLASTLDAQAIHLGLQTQFWVYALFYGIVLLSLLYGVLFVLPIGGADMPVVISLLNSFTGMAAACGGFLYNNKAMLTGGILVGAAGTLLTILMCKAMNRSLRNVLIGSFGSAAAAKGGPAAPGDQGSYKEISVSEAAVLMTYANKIMIVPGYGLAVAQAQHACHELEKLLSDKSVDVKYAIHPVAGRMPGHMNVLLAEADVSYDKLLEMERANDEFATTDLVLVLGANDVVNPAAKTDPASPIYGMPILEVESAKTVIVNKRSMKPGYAGIENLLFFQPKTSMLFGDAKTVLQQLIMVIKNL
jgi:NAD(P) transhydrogenase subunit beta